MRVAAFQEELLESVRAAAAYLEGSRKAVAWTDRISPHSVAAIRATLKPSQAQFARAFGISLDNLQNWEQGWRQPTGPVKGLSVILYSRHWSDFSQRTLRVVAVAP